MAASIPPGSPFPAVSVTKIGGGDLVLGDTSQSDNWRMIIIYRGMHCPLCIQYFKKLEEMRDTFREIGVDVVAASTDPETKAHAFIAETGTTVPIGYDLSLDQARHLGLYISAPRTPPETERPFAEPGLFVLNGQGLVEIVDISNAPFARPDLQAMANGIKFTREKGFPTRGTH